MDHRQPLQPRARAADRSGVPGVVVIDDHPIMRAGIAGVINDADDLELIGEAGDGEEGLALIRDLRPDVAIVDYRMPKLDGIAVCEALRDDTHRPHILLLSAADDPATVRRALEAGVAGFLGKDEPDDSIRSAIRRVLAGETILSVGLQTALVAHLAGRSTTPARLSDGELRVIQLAAEGLSNAEIATDVLVSTATVKTMLARAFEKLGVNDRAAAAAEAVRQGLIS